jgi:uncharacterized membrane protein
MAPTIVLLVSWLVLRGLGTLGLGAFATWQDDAAYALALMFLLTASAHFTKTRADLVRMVPAQLPFPRQIVTLTGICEGLGAIGLVIPATRSMAAVALLLLLVAMFPANVNAALRHIPLRGRPPTPLWLRVPMQILFIGFACWAWWASHG